MSLHKFTPKWRSVPDTILGITHEIWEERQIGKLYEYYADDIIVRAPGGIVVGNEAVIGATMATLAEFPDRQLLGEDVIWSGDKDTEFLSSHRILSTATHTGPGIYGAPTNTRLRYRIIADCAVRNSRVYDEWLVRDQGAIVRQMGHEPGDFARDLVARGDIAVPLTPETDLPARYTQSGNDHEEGVRYADTITRIMNAEISAIRLHYDRACHMEMPGGFTGHGHDQISRFWMGLRAAFPSASFRIDHRIGRSDPQMPPRAALRWSLHGKHDGWGTFGAPSGAEVYVLGISHAEFGPWGLRREWVVYDEVAIWRQIAMQQG